MGKMFGILLIIVGMWAGAEIYNNGTANAFGGILTTLGLAEATPETAQPTRGRRVRSKVAGAHAESEARRDRLLAE